MNRLRTRVGLGVLLLAVLIPIAVVELAKRETPSGALHGPSAADSVRAENPTPTRLASPGVLEESPRAPSPKLSGTTPVLPSRDHVPLWIVNGLRALATNVPATRGELRLQTPDDSRPVWTDSAGVFSFVLSEADFPTRLEAHVGADEWQLLWELTAPPATRILYLNLREAEATGEGAGIFQPWSIAAQCDLDGVLDLAVYGHTRLPLGSQVILNLFGGGDKLLEASLKRVDEGSCLGSLRVVGRRLFSGPYRVGLEWKVASADPEAIAALAPWLPDPVPGTIVSRYPFYVGREAQERKQQDQIRSYYDRAVEECQVSRDLIRWAGGKLRGDRVRLSAARMHRIRSHDAFDLVAGLETGTSLPLENWRRLIDEVLPRKWGPHRDRTLVPFPEKYPRLRRDLALLYQTLEKFTHLESRLVYRALDERPHPNDYVDYEFGPETEYQLTHHRLKNFLSQVRGSIPESTVTSF